jgi:hypothetical protein
MTMQSSEVVTTLDNPDVDRPEVDRQIIAALIHTEPALLHALYRTGISKEAVNARAARLGLTNEFIKRCRLTGIRPSLRKCIKCDASFLSAGPQNRLCRRCPPR